VSGLKRRITDKIQFLLASHERNTHALSLDLRSMDVPFQEVIFFILIIFVSEVQGKWVGVEREELLDTYYEQGKIFNHLHNRPVNLHPLF
jgi:hypothetical protein